ncbi:hypothetical protein C8A03DRAFT_37805, partial [Achaetomium macrosporum]
MGAHVSTASCAAHYHITPNCSVVLSEDNSTALLLGQNAYGEFQGDPDIAGIGVLGAFLCVTAASLLLSIASIAWWLAKNVFGLVNRITREEKSLKNWQLSIAGIIEALIVTCSDQQVFTGGAYAITLRYAKACSISAYHYNIVANILLVTCATHLMAITVARHYWKHPFVGVLRIAVTSLLFVITGVLLANRDSESNRFPTEVPDDKDKYSLMLLPASCFQGGHLTLADEVEKTLKVGSAKAFFSGQLHGWPNYVIMFLFYLIAVAMSLGRIIRRGTGRDGKRKKFIHWLKRVFPFFFRIKRFFYFLFGCYLLAGIAISTWTVATAAIYVFQLRWWVNNSGWMQFSNNQNPENDPSTFGQLVPLLLMSLTVFTFLQIVSERIHARRLRDKGFDYASLRGSSGTSYESFPHSSRTRYSTVSVLETGTTRDHGRGHVPEDEQQLCDPDQYDNDNTVQEKDKHEPVVSVTLVQEPDDMDVAEYERYDDYEQRNDTSDNNEIRDGAGSAAGGANRGTVPQAA